MEPVKQPKPDTCTAHFCAACKKPVILPHTCPVDKVIWIAIKVGRGAGV